MNWLNIDIGFPSISGNDSRWRQDVRAMYRYGLYPVPAQGSSAHAYMRAIFLLMLPPVIFNYLFLGASSVTFALTLSFPSPGLLLFPRHAFTPTFSMAAELRSGNHAK
ncbi:MAG: hypothetical protein OEN02_18765 [Gammaproteobacteria bacterium]|nr:hypothetical protein [Gammaproteobacteria bacterium]MDH3534290.1 hypothetical protein [Gammaproteobacteria bacterium]